MSTQGPCQYCHGCNWFKYLTLNLPPITSSITREREREREREISVNLCNPALNAKFYITQIKDSSKIKMIDEVR